MRVLRSVPKNRSENFDDAFMQLYDQTRQRVFGFLRARCGSVELAEEIMSETYLAALRALRSGKETEIGEGWLITVARRRLIDHWRRESTRQKYVGLVDHLDSDEPDLVLEERALRALAGLPPRQKAAVVLRYLTGLSVAEIADELRVSYKSAESLLSRGRTSLRRAFEEDDYVG